MLTEYRPSVTLTSAVDCGDAFGILTEMPTLEEALLTASKSPSTKRAAEKLARFLTQQKAL